MTPVSLRLPNAIATRLNRLAARTGRSKTYYITEAIAEHLDDLEDIYLAEKRLADIRAGKTQPLPLEDVLKRYDMEG
jgi:RHH-type rel operon transcriptional repressor/antitoxin RelB